MQLWFDKLFSRNTKLVSSLLIYSDNSYQCTCLERSSLVITPKLLDVMTGITEAYENAETSSDRRLILSIVAHQLDFRLLTSFLPKLTRYRFSDARAYAREFGSGAFVVEPKRTVQRFSSAQVTHFIDFILSPHICTDMPFGEKKIKLSNGTELTVPDTIRNLNSTRIIQHYYEYCCQMFIGFEPLGSSSLFKILEKCKASTRKAQQGLNNFVAEGRAAFEVLQKLVESLPIDADAKKLLKASLRQSKQYLKTDYKINVARSSQVPDHCIEFALSEKGSRHFEISCQHDHDEMCMECINLESTLFNIKNAIQSYISKDFLDRVMYDYNECTLSILAWKAHLLRCVNQDQCRAEIMRNLSPTGVYINVDWAMK